MTARYYGADITDSGTIAIIANDGDVITIGSAAHIVENGFVAIAGFNNVTVQVAGFVYGADVSIDFGIPSTIGHDFVSVLQGGTVMGGKYAISVEATAANVSDNGAISGGIEGINILYLGGGNTITVGHNGTVTGGQFGIHSLGSKGEVINDGAISGGVDGLNLAGGKWTIDNTGTISAPGGDAILMTGGGRNAVLNSGHIAGGIVFSSGNDSYDGSQGHITGAVIGGSGNDTLTGGANDDNLNGGRGTDVLNGGAGSDILTGGVGADRLAGAAGNDTFIYATAGDSTGQAHDTVAGFDALQDNFKLNVKIRALNFAEHGTLRAGAHFDSDLAAVLTVKHFGAHHAVLFTATAGTDKGETFLVVDGNGHAGYQANADYVIELTGAAHLANLSVHDFI